MRPAAPAYFTRVGGAWRPVSWAAYVDECRLAARALIALGITSHCRIALLGNNRPEWVVAYQAVMLVGGAAAGIYTTSSADDVAHVVNDSESTVVLVEDRAQYDKVAARELPGVQWIVTMRGAPAIDSDARVLTWEQFLQRGRTVIDTELDDRIAALDSRWTATMIYTSGTTGRPKGVLLTHANLAWSASTLVALGNGTANDCVLSYLPLSHIAEQLATIHLPTTTGSPVYYCEALDRVRENVIEVRPTVFFGVPRVWEKIHAVLEQRFAALSPARRRLLAWARGVCTQASAHEMRGEPLGRVLELQYALAQRLVIARLKAALGMDRARLLVSGAAPIAKHVLEFFASLDMIILELYGMSECVPISFNVPGRTKLGTVGPPVPGLDVRISDDGEILVRGPGVFMAYYNDIGGTEETLRDGWLHSGDLGAIDADGFLSITGRKKELLITAGGHNVAPKNLEAGIKRCPLVGEAVVIGDRRKYLTALVTMVDGVATTDATRAEIQQAIDRLNATVARSEQIKKHTILPRPFSVESGELTPTMKLKRATIAERYAAEIAAMYRDD